MKKVFLGVGHGGNDPGAVGYVVEKEINLIMALACRDYLIANGVEVKMSRTKDENDSLTEEINECNEYNPDLAIDIHNNAGRGDGFEAYYGIAKVGLPLAQNIETEIKALGQNSRGLKTKLNSKGNADYYGFIRLIKCPSIIVEGVFVDNAEDIKIADTIEEQKAFGVAYAKGILKTLGIKETQQVEKPEKETKSITDLAYEVIAGKWGTGIDRKNRLSNAGYDYNAIQAKVNEMLSSKTIKKSIDQLAREVIQGKWGVGTDRKNKLTAAGYDYNAVQKRVNQLM